MRVLVTGAAGLVGSRLVPRLQDAGHSVHACDAEVDVSESSQVGPLVSDLQPEGVIHLAAISSTRPGDDPNTIFRINFCGAKVLFDSITEFAPAARVIFVSSGLIYGPLEAGQTSFTEESPLRAAGAYGWSKAAADRLGEERAANGLDLIRARPFNHTAAGRREDFVESRLAKQIAAIELGQQEPVVDAFNVEAERDFLVVDDVVEAYVALLDPSVPTGAYNIASGQGVSIREVWERLLAHTDATPTLRTQIGAQDATDRSVGDATLLAKATGWSPAGQLDRALAEILEYWRCSLASEGD